MHNFFLLTATRIAADMPVKQQAVDMEMKRWKKDRLFKSRVRSDIKRVLAASHKPFISASLS